MSRTSLKQQLMREQLQQQEKREALLRQRQLQRIKVDPSTTAMDTSDIVHSTDMIKLTDNSIDHPMQCSPNFNHHHHAHRHQFNHAQHMSITSKCGNENGLNHSSHTPTTNGQINYPQLNHLTSTTGSGPQSPFPLSPESPLSGPRSSASELDEYWEDVHRTLAVDMPDFLVESTESPVGDGGGGGGGPGSGGPGSGGSSGGGEAGNHNHHSPHHHHHHQIDNALASTLPTEMFVPFASNGYSDSRHSQLSDKMSTSCPPLTDADYSAWERERKKKDAHNRIERRRRYHINDRIKELSTLLPTQDEARYYEIVKDIKQNKGTILKASVDFLRSLKRDVNRIPELERQKRELEIENKKMSRRIQQLEQDLRSILSEDRNSYSN